MNSETLSVLMTQILCSIFVVIFLLKTIPARSRKLKKINVNLKVEASQLSNKLNELTDRVFYLSTELDKKMI